MFKKLKNKKILEAEKLERKFEILKNRKLVKERVDALRKKLNNSDDNDNNDDNYDNDDNVINLNNINFNNLLSNPNMTSEIAEELGKYFLKMTNKKRNKDSENNGDDDVDDDDDDDDMNPNIKIIIENILDNDLVTPEYLEELSKNFFKLANAMRSKDNEDDSESSGNNSESSVNNNESSGNNNESSGNNNDYNKELVDESKELLKTIEKNDKDKKNISVDKLVKKLNPKAEDDRKINEKLKEYDIKEAQRASEKVEKFNKMINDNLDMPSEKK